MSLEKLLLFGLALAVVAAVTVSATGTTEDRVTQTDGYREKVEGLAEMAK